jgi:hypothetical protein
MKNEKLKPEKLESRIQIAAKRKSIARACVLHYALGALVIASFE